MSKYYISTEVRFFDTHTHTHTHCEVATVAQLVLSQLEKLLCNQLKIE